ncbi:hypothetical protein C8039_13865 [Halogeometricum sp. wsp3]|nr:hypothetical protein C8039_13865 [Halogeometricum sp. wsp3]
MRTIGGCHGTGRQRRLARQPTQTSTRLSMPGVRFLHSPGPGVYLGRSPYYTDVYDEYAER